MSNSKSLNISSNYKYDRIPDSSEGATKSGSSFWRYLGYGIVVLLLGGVVYSFLMTHYATFNDENQKVQVFQTSKEHRDRFKRLSVRDFVDRGFQVESLIFQSTEQQPSADTLLKTTTPTSRIDIDTTITYQEVIGFGGAFTEAAAHNFFTLPADIQEKVLDFYFGDNGIGFTLGRIHINSCDFSPESYSFDDVAGDYDLQYFDHEVHHDQAEIIPFLRAAILHSSQPIRLLASPWSPPAWMKKPFGANASTTMTGSATPNGLQADTRTMDAWAKYISYFIEAYAQQAVHIWAITPQNEPEFAAPWEACSYNSSFEKEFIVKHLGPTIRSNHPDVKILAFDHNKDHLLQWAQDMYSDDMGMKYVDGMAFHWYTGQEDRLLDGSYGFDAVNSTHHLAPQKVLLATEACSCPGVKLGDWSRAERLGHDVMYDMLNWAQGWIDWNLIVDHKGGPNHLQNFCDASMILTEAGDDIIIQPRFFYLGHFSGFIPPGSVRVHSNVVGHFNHAIRVDDNARSGIEVAVFPCEQSIRQEWQWIGSRSNGKLRLNQYDAPSSAVRLCLGSGDVNRPYLRLVPCDSINTLSLQLLQSSETGDVHMIDIVSRRCVSHANNRMASGALLNLVDCASTSTVGDLWTLDFAEKKSTKEFGEVLSPSSGMCVTAGWPFFSAIAFKTKADKHALVVINEAPLDTSYGIYDVAKKKELHIGIGANAIQTVLF